MAPKINFVEFAARNTTESPLALLVNLDKAYLSVASMKATDPEGAADKLVEVKEQIANLGLNSITHVRELLADARKRTNTVVEPTLAPESTKAEINTKLSTEGVTVFSTPDAFEDEPEVVKALPKCQFCGMDVKGTKKGKHESTCAKNPKSDTFKRNATEELKRQNRANELEKAKKLNEAASSKVEPKDSKEQLKAEKQTKAEDTNQAEMMAQLEREESERKAFEARMQAEAEAALAIEKAEALKKAQELASVMSFDEILAEISRVNAESRATIEAATARGLAWSVEYDALQAELKVALEALERIENAIAVNREFAKSCPTLTVAVPQYLIDVAIAKKDELSARVEAINNDPRKADYNLTHKAKIVAEINDSVKAQVYTLDAFKKAFPDRIAFERRDGSTLNGSPLYCISKTLMEIMESEPVSDNGLHATAYAVALDVLKTLGVDANVNKSLLEAMATSQVTYAKRIHGGAATK
jgi:hypothetical protein